MSLEALMRRLPTTPGLIITFATFPACDGVITSQENDPGHEERQHGDMMHRLDDARMPSDPDMPGDEKDLGPDMEGTLPDMADMSSMTPSMRHHPNQLGKDKHRVITDLFVTLDNLAGGDLGTDPVNRPDRTFGQDDPEFRQIKAALDEIYAG